MMKIRGELLFVFSVLLIGFFADIVSAQYYGSSGYGFGFGAERFIDSMTRNLEPILTALFGGQDYTGYLLFEKLLLFILVSVFSYLALSNFPFFKDKNKHLARLIAIIVALIGIRNLDYVWFNTIFTQYAVLFVSIAGVLPFIIYWFFLKEMDSLPRKFGWIFFAVVYFGLWITTDVDAHEEIYLITALAALLYAFVLDAWVHNRLEINAMKKGNKARLSETIAENSEEIERIETLLAGGHYRSPRAEKLAREKIDRLENRIRKLQKGI